MKENDMCDLKEVVKKVRENSREIFDHMKVKIRDLEKEYTHGAWFDKAEFTEAVSCQDVWHSWIFEWLNNHGIEMKADLEIEGGPVPYAWEFVAEISGNLLMYPVMDLYKDEIDHNSFAVDIIEIWDMGNPLDLKELRRNHLLNFKKDLNEVAKRWLAEERKRR